MELDFSPSYVASVLSEEPYHGAPEKVEAFRWIVSKRYEWLTTFGAGTNQLISSMGWLPVEASIPILVENHDRISIRDLINEAIILGKFFHHEAERQAHEYARQHIDEIWANRRNTDYVPPWETEFSS